MKKTQSFLLFGFLLVFVAAQIGYPFMLVYAEEEGLAPHAEEGSNSSSQSSVNDFDSTFEEGAEDEVVATDSTEEKEGASLDQKKTDEKIDSLTTTLSADESLTNREEPAEVKYETEKENAPLTNLEQSLYTETESEEVDVTADAGSGPTSTQSDATEFLMSSTTAVIGSSSSALIEEIPTTTQTTTIVSGEAIALANILNMVNSNFVNSEGVVLFSNFFETVFGAIDFREYFQGLVGYGCSLISCQGQNIAVNIDNNASIDNDVFISAHTGNNQITHVDHGEITTGNAYAGLNLVNVANTNLIDSNYLLVTLNAFGGVEGDIVFPSLSQFFSSLAYGASTPQVIDLKNTAVINNDVTVRADTGENTATHVGGSSISTGDAVGSTHVFNQLNSSLIGGQSVSIVFRVHGSWAGDIYGAPDNLAWTVGDDGSIYLFDVGGGSQSGNLTLHGTNTLKINNKVNVVALTGENAITHAQTAVISTGNAYAGANIINVANANVIGRNWILAVINIFGDFNGNIAFGRPDLWVGGQIDVPKSIQNGSELLYKFTVINNGDSPAHNVRLTTSTNGDYLKVNNASHEFIYEDGKMVWNIGKLPPGSATEISYQAVVQHTGDGTDIEHTALVESKETDNNINDNKEVLVVTTDESRGNGIRIEKRTAKVMTSEERKVEEVEEVTLFIKRVSSAVEAYVNDPTAEQKLILRNPQNIVAENVVLHDILRNPMGEIIRDEVWELGDVLPYEEIELGYTIAFKNTAPLGIYTLHTRLEGTNTVLAEELNGTIALAAVAEIPVIPSPLFTFVGGTNEEVTQEQIASLFDFQTENADEPDRESASRVSFSTPIANAAESNLAAVGTTNGNSNTLFALFALFALIFTGAYTHFSRR